MKTQNVRLWERFPELTEAVRQDHIRQKAFGSGHDFYHALMVAQYGFLIAVGPDTAVLGWVAGLCHNTDRIFPKDQVEYIVRYYLDEGTMFSSEVKELVLEAILEHSKKNDPKDNPVTVALKDADRLGNIGSLHWLRSAQFQPTIQVVDPRFISETDPTATFRNPKTLIHDIKETLLWESWLRLPKAKELGKPVFEEIRRFLKNIESQFETLGLYPFPQELIVEAQESK